MLLLHLVSLFVICRIRLSLLEVSNILGVLESSEQIFPRKRSFGGPVECLGILSLRVNVISLLISISLKFLSGITSSNN